ncbi:VP3-like protein [Sulfolobus spindle-shaped virus 6]|uniref:VP3-like protein n=1 Tax=Sulfolobus spindle-shaped virus 6 TaxID=693627 RepID=D1GF51_9VIRU|nr:virion structural protein [Sulfolobus spindle-shaped virus 6]ACZ35752.1 VP3-like protein [Sulfolobus spindle-shaped virus 6]
MEFDTNVKTIIALFIFILVGIVFFSPIITYVNQVSSPGSYTTVVSGTITTSSFVSNPYYAGSSGAIIASLVPIFYLLAIIAVPAFIIYRMVRER